VTQLVIIYVNAVGLHTVAGDEMRVLMQSAQQYTR